MKVSSSALLSLTKFNAALFTRSRLGRPLLYGYRQTWNLHSDREETDSSCEVERSPVIAAKSDVRGGLVSVDDATKFLAFRIDYVKTAGAPTVEIALSVNLDSVGYARFGAAEIHENAAGIPCSCAVRQHVVCPHMSPPRVRNVEDIFIVGEGNTVGPDHVVDDERHRSEIR
jgi:hypothetical protein